MTDFSKFENALSSLEEALTKPPANDLERDGAIQRFEYCFEMAWKLGQRVLAQHGITSNSPKSVIRDLGQQGWIGDARVWIEFLNARNSATHLYKKDVAEQVFGQTTKFLPEARNLLAALKSASSK